MVISGGVRRLPDTVACQELDGLLSSQVPIQNSRIDRREINHHQGVQRVSKLRVDVESKQFRVDAVSRYEVTGDRAYSLRSRVDSAWRARCSRTFTAVGVIPSVSATSCVESSSISRSMSTVR